MKGYRMRNLGALVCGIRGITVGMNGTGVVRLAKIFMQGHPEHHDSLGASYVWNERPREPVVHENFYGGSS